MNPMKFALIIIQLFFLHIAFSQVHDTLIDGIKVRVNGNFTILNHESANSDWFLPENNFYTVDSSCWIEGKAIHFCPFGSNPLVENVLGVLTLEVNQEIINVLILSHQKTNYQIEQNIRVRVIPYTPDIEFVESILCTVLQKEEKIAILAVDR
jgi:hypothetical protein